MTRQRKVLPFFALLGLLFLVCPMAPAQSLRIPPHDKFVLKNGLTVLLMEKRGVPLINVFALVKTGAAADPAGQEGLASVTAGLLRKGTKTRTAQQFSADFDYIGGSFGADGREIRACISPKRAADIIEVSRKLLGRPRLRPFPQKAGRDGSEPFLADGVCGSSGFYESEYID